MLRRVSGIGSCRVLLSKQIIYALAQQPRTGWTDNEFNDMTGTGEENYFSRRWRGRVPLPQLLWRDMLGIGTLINLVATLLALAAITQGAPSGLAVALHFAPLPYNVFLFGALWRTPGRNEFAVGLAVVWLFLMTLV
jgi:hypothetical protein